jgi:hypothetical protein
MPPSLSYTWVIMDDNACRICKAINGYTWTFNGEPAPNQLVHPVYGIVWDVARGSGAHEHTGTPGKCRCRLDVKLEYKEWVEKTKQYCTNIEKAINQT